MQPNTGKATYTFTSVIISSSSQYSQRIDLGDIKRIHHLCSVGTGKSQPEGPPFQWETRLRSVSHWNGGPEGWDFPVPLYTNDRFYFSHV